MSNPLRLVCVATFLDFDNLLSDNSGSIIVEL